MINRFENIKPTYQEAMRGGVGVCTLYKVEELPKNIKMYAKIVIPYKASIGLHTHIGDAETIYVLKGSASCIDDGKPTILSAGDINICKSGHSHSIINDQCEEFVFLAVVTKEEA